MDDYRDTSWREGSAGPLAKPIPGSGIAPVRWINDTKEVEEIYFQSSDKAITGRMYIGTTWQSNIYGIDGTETIPRQGASISATTVERMNSSMVLLVLKGQANPGR